MAIQPPTITGGGSLPNIGVPYSQVGPTAVPDFTTLLNYLLQTGAQAGQGVPKLSDIISQGASSPLMQEILGPALQNLIPGEQLARQAMADQFRAAGMMGSGAEGISEGRLETGLQQQRGNLISQIMSSILPTLVSGMNQQAANQFRLPELLAQALGISRPSVVTGRGGTMGGAGGAGGTTSMANNPFFTPDVFAAGGAGGMGGGGGGGLGPQPGAPQGFQNPAAPGFSYGATPGYGGGAWAPTTPIDWGSYAGLGGGTGTGIMQNPATGGYVNDPYGTPGYMDVGGAAGPGGINWGGLMGDVMGGASPLDIGMANPYGDTSFISNQGAGFGAVPIQPQDYWPSNLDASQLDFSV